MKYQALSKISLKSHPELTERWVQDRIAENPQMLGLGDVVLKDKERIQPRAGRLDLLLQDAEANHLYKVEIQLGKTDAFVGGRGSGGGRGGGCRAPCGLPLACGGAGPARGEGT